ncbi:VOC family protein [Bacillus sp. FJAT-49736]|uniref:VOC family protein n=1 Tax=Bacillus sp. FJAT-49736 TaxID=2833582 RepID=UPI001BC9CBEE|nr:VOC family protein [Bacillus sp. FJAT-49736]MBS4175360.1 VOC family protein [Bacillus sp. FJAT-49736]
MLHHIEIYVSDLEQTTKFWDWFLTKLGYQVYQKWDKGISWKHESTYIVFVQADKKYLDIPYHRCRVGLNHLAFRAKSRQQVDDITLELKEKGIKILYSDRHPFAGGPSYYAVYFEDPDRIKVELVAPGEGEEQR